MAASDCIIAEVSSKEIGEGIEIGFFEARNKPISYLRQATADMSNTVEGLAALSIMYYDTPDAIRQLSKSILS